MKHSAFCIFALAATVASATVTNSPYATRVVSCHTDATSDWYNNPTNVLGRPGTYMTGDWGGVISPMNSAWTEGLLLTVETFDSPAHVTVEFDHQVEDDPLNPYGIDFIVFGNTFVYSEGWDYYYDGVDPFSIRFGDGAAPEPGLVEVSQDGVTWYAFADGPFADTMPTLGHVIDTNAPNASLFAGNLWWGAETDPTVPTDPRITYADYMGVSLGEICLRMGKSAGGDGFDISRFDLPRNERGMKWIKYVRVSPMPTGELDDEGYPVYTTPEVDAFCDVAPASAYDCWARNLYDWSAFHRQGGKSDIAVNGRTNHENFVLGLGLDEVCDLAFRVTDFHMADGKFWLAFDSNAPYSGILNVRGKASLGASWTETVGATYQGSDLVNGLWRNSYFIDSDGITSRFFGIEVPSGE